MEWLVGQEVVCTNLTSLHHSSFVFFQTSLSIPSTIVPVLTDGRPLLSQDPGQPPSFPMGRAMRRVSWNSTALLVVGATNGHGRPRSNWVRQMMVHQMSHLVV